MTETTDQNITTDEEVIEYWGAVQGYNLDSKQDREHAKKIAKDVFCHWGDVDNQEQRVAKLLLMALSMLPAPTMEDEMDKNCKQLMADIEILKRNLTKAYETNTKLETKLKIAQDALQNTRDKMPAVLDAVMDSWRATDEVKGVEEDGFELRSSYSCLTHADGSREETFWHYPDD